MSLADRKADLRRLVDDLRRTLALVWSSSAGWTLASLVLVVIQGLLPLATLYLLKLTVDGVADGLTSEEKGAVFGRVLVLVIATGFVVLAGAAASALARVVRDALSVLVTDRVYELIHSKAIEADLASYENPTYYDALHRAHEEAPLRPTRILISLMGVGQSAITIVAIGGWLASVDWRIGVVLMLSVVPGLWARVSHSFRVYHWQRAVTPIARRAQYYDTLLADPGVAKEVRAFSLGALFARRFAELRARLRREELALSWRRCVRELATEALAVGAVFGSCALIAWRALQGAVTVGDVAMYYQAFLRVQASLRELLTQLGALYEDRLFVSQLFEFLETPARVCAPSRPAPVPRPMLSGFALRDVDFRYPGSHEQALDGVSLEVGPGEVVALVGENGSGKTTVVKLLCRLYDPERGEITLDGTPLSAFEPATLRRQIAVILQDYARYHLSARENVWLGNVATDPRGEGVRSAAMRAGVHEKIASLPQDYDTVLGKRLEEGTELSTGEWQKLALARALYRDAQLVVLDEPTSSVDARSEAQLFRDLRQRLRGAAALLISHRLSTVRLADRIVVLDDGRVVESGTHDELVRRGGTYARLFRIQAAPYLDGDGVSSASAERVA